MCVCALVDVRVEPPGVRGDGAKVFAFVFFIIVVIFTICFGVVAGLILEYEVVFAGDAVISVESALRDVNGGQAVALVVDYSPEHILELGEALAGDCGDEYVRDVLRHVVAQLVDKVLVEHVAF